jgi:sarcosine oxidase gamma subunit
MFIPTEDANEDETAAATVAAAKAAAQKGQDATAAVSDVASRNVKICIGGELASPFSPN